MDAMWFLLGHAMGVEYAIFCGVVNGSRVWVLQVGSSYGSFGGSMGGV